MSRVLFLCLCLSLSGCSSFYSTRVHLSDGTVVDALPRCVNGSGADRRLVGEGIEDGVQVSNVDSMSSHAGLEPLILGSALLAAGVAAAIYGFKSGEEGWIAVGGVTGGLSIIQVVLGAVLLSSSTGAIDRPCHFRSSWFEHTP